MDKKPNHLIHEKSPYLLEHAYNPVNWYSWGQEAFDASKKENKPIFLSIGYSSCHWCHVMARESFEDDDISRILNENFIPIKVDREARPDVDEIYMKAVISMTGSGGWPLSVFLTPELKPFYGGTYFPPVPRGGMPSFPQLLMGISRAWKSDQEKIVESSKQLEQSIKNSYTFAPKNGSKLNEAVFDKSYASLSSAFDEDYGGFGFSPKFPTPSNLFFLFRYYLRNKTQAPLIMAEKTLESMANGGICDHIGGGFHRYSVDRQWLVPHFEKMLYDNALLCLGYTEAYQLTKKPNYLRVAEQILEWTIREMTAPSGAFFSALDADSPEGEGAFYVWDRSEVSQAVGLKNIPNSGRLVDILCDYYGVTDQGNFEDGRTILTRSADRIAEIEKKFSISKSELSTELERGRLAMLNYRSNRPRPKTDDKVLVSWNGLMIAAFARAHEVFGVDTYLLSAKTAADFILEKMWQRESGNGLKHWFREGLVMDMGTLEDYAFLIFGLIELYEASFDAGYLSKAVDLAKEMISSFEDARQGGFFMTDDKTRDLIVRPKDAYDGALPSGNAVAVLSLLRLARLTGNEEFRQSAEKSLDAFSPLIVERPTSYVFSLVAFDYLISKSQEIVLAGLRSSKEFLSMLQVVRNEFSPHSVLAYAEPGREALIPLIEGRILEGNGAKAYVCTDYTCKLPSNTSEELKAALDTNSEREKLTSIDR